MKHIRKQKLKEQGITLIALVVTIIVLLILAGVTINLALSNNGIINRAASAKEESTRATDEEQINLEVLASYGTDGKLNFDETLGYYDLLTKNLGNISGLTDENDSLISVDNPITTLPVKVELNGYTYNINEDGSIERERTRVYSEEVKVALTEGKYVTYDGKTYKVLYDVNSGYGWIEIVSVDALEKVTLGYEDSEIPETSPEGYNFSGSDANNEKARWSYNNAIATLNKKAQKYKTNLADRARCIGSDPVNPLSESGDYTDYLDNYNDTARAVVVKDEDINYIKSINSTENNKDYEQLRKQKINDSFTNTGYGNYYWLASRKISAYTNNTYFNVRKIGESGHDTDDLIFIVYYYGSTLGAQNCSNGFRPVIRLKDTVKITGGKGTVDSPYELGIA